MAGGDSWLSSLDPTPCPGLPVLWEAGLPSVRAPLSLDVSLLLALRPSQRQLPLMDRPRVSCPWFAAFRPKVIIHPVIAEALHNFLFLGGHKFHISFERNTLCHRHRAVFALGFVTASLVPAWFLQQPRGAGAGGAQIPAHGGPVPLGEVPLLGNSRHTLSVKPQLSAIAPAQKRHFLHRRGLLSLPSAPVQQQSTELWPWHRGHAPCRSLAVPHQQLTVPGRVVSWDVPHPLPLPLRKTLVLLHKHLLSPLMQYLG